MNHLNRKYIWVALCGLLVGACTEEKEDIQRWMTQEERSMKGRVTPLPEVGSFPEVEYVSGSVVEPFESSRIEPEARASSVGGPDLNRQREPLEAFPLESLSMVGILEQGGIKHALITADKSLYQIKAGNYIGQNHGIVTQIDETEMKLVELVEDMNGDWVERISTLLLQER